MVVSSLLTDATDDARRFDSGKNIPRERPFAIPSGWHLHTVRRVYFTGGVDQRMNGICAGGTGSFIDQMASLLQTDASGLNELAKNYHEIYPIAARCGVFAKTDIQPLINEGAAKEDLAASIFQAVVNQTISGLACGSQQVHSTQHLLTHSMLPMQRQELLYGVQLRVEM